MQLFGSLQTCWRLFQGISKANKTAVKLAFIEHVILCAFETFLP